MTWVLENLDVIAGYTGAHLLQALPPILVAFLLSLPLAKLANSRGWLRTSVTTTSSLMYAIPSLPLFVLLPGLIGTGVRSPLNIAVALSLYGLALMVPAAADAFRSVSRDVLGSATAQGYAPRARFFQVELPLAGPVLLAGVRVVAVSTISLVTVGGVLGVPSLGMLFVDGVRRGILAEIAAGIVATVVLALLTDTLLVLLGRAVMPWARRQGVGTP
ncbi:ABC transporter permease [Brachybacterium avium]|uniref:ABC transporter permease n=1 Tax=Brachybacterium avium TaxID=2017485 RepID=A0A220UCP2_9MICO|nr:ABC transporter permease subunit [Brachybacterium avium]ASK65682.1 ABC transporter permease [Brachybacterium avium]